MTKRGHYFTKVLLVSMLLTLTIALGGCAGDKEEEGSSQVADIPATETDNGNAQADTADAQASSITIGIPQDLNSFDPNTAQGSGTQEMLFNIYEGLLKPDVDGNLVPAVASDYAVSEDGKVYTFTLREGIKFHNGNSVTVEDVKYSIDKCAGNGTGEPLVSAFSIVESVETPDDKTIVVNLSEADEDFLAILSTVEASIVPADVEDLETNPVGTGPYMFVSRSLQENVVLKKFDAYWGEPAHIENVTLKVIADGDSIVMNFQGGSIDLMARITTTQAAQLGEEFNIVEGTSNMVQAMYLNNAVEPFNNEKVRQALSYAINKQEIIDFMADGKGTPIGSSMFPAFGKYYMEELNDVYPTDIEKAKELLAQAGYPDGFTFTITVPSNYQPHIDTATVLAEQFKAIGVTANIEMIEWESWLSDVYSARNYEATVVGVDASNLTAGALLHRFVSTAHNNFVNYNNPEYDAAYEKAQNAASDEEATKYYKECETILTNTSANVYIQDMAKLVAMNKKYAGFEFYPLYVMDIAKLYIVE